MSDVKSAWNFDTIAITGIIDEMARLHEFVTDTTAESRIRQALIRYPRIRFPLRVTVAAQWGIEKSNLENPALWHEIAETGTKTDARRGISRWTLGLDKKKNASFLG